MTPRTHLALSGVLAAALLAGCSGDGDEGGVGDPPGGGPSSATSTATASPTAAGIEWERAEPEDEGFDAARLERLAREAEAAGSTCFAVARHGRLVGEWYWDGSSATTPKEVFSVTKSVTSTLVGIAQADGSLSVEDRASQYIPEWVGTPSDTVTVRNLLANDSGREWTRQGDYGQLLQAPDRSSYAVGLGQDHQPGEVWVYNNAAIQTLDRVLRAATGSSPADFAEERLFGPLGMTQTRMTADGSGRSTNTFFGLQSTCPDLARFGQLFAQDGRFQGERLLPEAWVRDAVGQPSQELNAAYGLLWWLNRSGPLRPPIDEDDPDAAPGVTGNGQLAPGAPEGLFAAQGFGGQVVLVDPRSETVVVRLGTPTRDGRASYRFSDAARVVTEALTNP